MYVLCVFRSPSHACYLSHSRSHFISVSLVGTFPSTIVPIKVKLIHTQKSIMHPHFVIFLISYIELLLYIILVEPQCQFFIHI